MGLLDDLRNQAQGQRTAEKENAERLGDREQHYRELMLPRMVRAYQYFKELTDHLNYIKFDTVAEYPLYANGATQPMHQKGYAVRIDSSKELKQIDITFQCVLESPITFELYNRDTILNHSEKLDRYFVKYERTDKKNNKLEVVASSFTITGPLPLKIGLTANIANSDIRIAVRNFTDPGTNTYTIKTEEFDDAFLDKLGKYMLRKEPSLMLKTPASAEMSQEAKAQLREKILREQKLREQELREAEEQERLAEEQRRQNTAKAHLKKAMNEQTDHLKKAVNTQIEQKKEMFKGMFDKLKNQAASVLKSEPKNTVPAQQAAQQSVSQPPLQTRPRTDASITNTGQRQPIPRTPVPPGQSQMAAPSARIESSRVSPGVKAPAPANAAPKQQAPAQTTAPTERRQTQPPKIFNASPDNPFIKPEPPEPVEPQEQAEATVAPEASATPAPVKLEANAIPAQVKPDVNTTAAAPVKPELTMTPAPVKPEANATAAPVKPELTMTPAPVKPEANATAAPVKPELTMTPAPVKPEANATPAPRNELSTGKTSAGRSDLTPESLEEDLAKILERDNYTDIRVDAKKTPVKTPVSNSTVSSNNAPVTAPKQASSDTGASLSVSTVQDDKHQEEKMSTGGKEVAQEQVSQTEKPEKMRLELVDDDTSPVEDKPKQNS